MIKKRVIGVWLMAPFAGIITATLLYIILLKGYYWEMAIISTFIAFSFGLSLITEPKPKGEDEDEEI